MKRKNRIYYDGPIKRRYPTNLKGVKINKLTAINHVETNKRGKVWMCECDCGNFKKVHRRDFIRGDTTSCGCAKILPDNMAQKHIIFRNYIKNAKNRNISFDISFEDMLNFIDKECYYCGILNSNEITTNTGTVYRYNGIDRVDSNKGYTLDNCVTCCYYCNSFKREQSFDEFLNRINRIYVKWLKGDV